MPLFNSNWIPMRWWLNLHFWSLWSSSTFPACRAVSKDSSLGTASRRSMKSRCHSWPEHKRWLRIATVICHNQWWYTVQALCKNLEPKKFRCMWRSPCSIFLTMKGFIKILFAAGNGASLPCNQIPTKMNFAQPWSRWPSLLATASARHELDSL